jgi:hypothetical protein
MIKSQELNDPTSCLNRAREDEMTFVLLGRDVAAPAAVRCWAQERVRLGKNQWDDKQIAEAMQWANKVEGGTGRGTIDNVTFSTPADLRAALDRSQIELYNLKVLLNAPEVDDFDKAVPLEAAHQVLRWGAEADAGKTPPDWFWLVGYLAGKALAAALGGDQHKAKHHCISTAAVLRNWHAHIRSGESAMRPGISAEKQASVEGE